MPFNFITMPPPMDLFSANSVERAWRQPDRHWTLSEERIFRLAMAGWLCGRLSVADTLAALRDSRTGHSKGARVIQ